MTNYTALSLDFLMHRAARKKERKTIPTNADYLMIQINFLLLTLSKLFCIISGQTRVPLSALWQNKKKKVTTEKHFVEFSHSALLESVKAALQGASRPPLLFFLSLCVLTGCQSEQ